MLQNEPSVTYLTQDNFVEEARQHEGFILVEAFSLHNGISHMIMPLMKEVYEKFNTHLKYCRLDIVNEPYVSTKLKLPTAPSFVIMANGRVVDRIKGLVPKKVLLNKIKIAIRTEASIKS